MKKYFLFLLLLINSVWLKAQNDIILSGTVTDKTNSPLVGATIVVKGTTKGTIADFDGSYILKGLSNHDIVIFSMVGYASQEIPIGDKNRLDVVLQEDLQEIDDVVVIGYGTAKKSDLTSSITSVKGEELKQISAGNAVAALQGKAPGVQITGSGGPGSVPRVIIRGVTTVNGSDPLYVVDGVPIDGNINFLNQNDIESMEILKDASASAIYGTRGSNGVILVTTKKGKAGKTKFQFNSSVGFQHIPKVNVADAPTYEKFFKERYTNDGNEPVWNSGDNLTAAEGTDWWNQTINKYAMQQSYNLSFQGGSESVVFSGSIGWFDQKSQYDAGYWKRLTGRFNMEYKFSHSVKFGVDFNPKYETWEDTPGIFGSILQMDPTTPVFKAKSVWTSNSFDNYARSYNNQVWNPSGIIARQNAHSKEYGLQSNPYLTFEPIDGLVVKTQIGINGRFRISDSFTPEFFIDNLEQNQNSKAERTSNTWMDWTWNNTVNYMKTLNEKHNLNLMAGYTMERYSNYWLTGSREAIPSNLPDLQYPSAGTINPQASGTDSHNSLISYLGRVMYNYNNRYYVTASMRVDGSSRFPTGEKYAVFPSGSVSWRLSEENFMKNQKLFQNLKVRAGWGRVGNQNIASGAYLNLIGNSDYVFNGERFVGTSISQVGNSLLKWETVEDINIGIDMSLLDNRLDFTADWFRKKSEDMLMERNNLLILGYPMWDGRMWTNVGSMKAQGWELSFNWRDSVREFKYGVGLNLSSIKNTAIKFTGESPIYGGSFFNDYITKNEEGKEISRFWGYVADGIFQNWTEVYAHTDDAGTRIQPDAQPGDIRFRDLNRDGSLDENDKRYIGNAFPDLILGLNLNLEYKGFDLVANFYGTLGNDIYNAASSPLNSGEGGSNIYADAYDKSWRGEGTSNKFPRLSVNDTNMNYRRVSTFFVEDGSYLRCKLLQFGYTLPKSLTRDAYTVRLSVSAQNLFTITNYSGMDPEGAAMGGVLESGIDNYVYPNPQTWLFGLNINF
jgi:TonB-linked SusC/RagA family outer membrane protein